jgi:pimeloyl-ACP methyl ester carboxylesterase
MFPMETFDVTLVNMEANLDLSTPEAPRMPRRPPLRERLGFMALQSAFRVGSILAPEVTAERALHYFMAPVRIPRPGWENETLKSARRITLKNGLKAYAWGRGPRVLIVHGWDGRGTQMARVAMAVAEAGFEAVAVDLPGHGDSPGGMLHAGSAKDALLQVGEELGPFHAIIGHSFGASASLYAVYQGLDAGRVIYISGHSNYIDLFDRYCAWVGVFGRAREIFGEKVAALVEVDPAESYPAVWVKKIDQPALIIHDRDDEDAPFSDGEQMHRAWKGSRFLRTFGLGHRRVLKSKEVIAEVVSFLRT